MSAEREFNRDGPIEYARLEELIDHNRPLHEIFRAFPAGYMVLEDRWADLMDLLGIPFDPGPPPLPWWVDFEGAVIWLLHRHFLQHVPNPSEVYQFEFPMLNFVEARMRRPLLPIEQHGLAFYVRDGELIIREPRDPRPTSLGRCKP